MKFLTGQYFTYVHVYALHIEVIVVYSCNVMKWKWNIFKNQQLNVLVCQVETLCRPHLSLSFLGSTTYTMPQQRCTCPRSPHSQELRSPTACRSWITCLHTTVLPRTSALPAPPNCPQWRAALPPVSRTHTWDFHRRSVGGQIRTKVACTRYEYHRLLVCIPTIRPDQ